MKFQYILKEEDITLEMKEIIRSKLHLSSRLTRSLKRNGEVLLNGKPVKLYQKGQAGDQLDVLFPEEPPSDFPAEAIPVHIIHEDDALMILNKQPGVVVHPTKGHVNGTIANGLTLRMQEQGGGFKIRFVNRLDRDTSGLLIVAKNAFAQDYLTRQMQENSVEKRYVAVVKGIIEEEQGTIDLPIDRASEDSVNRIVTAQGYPSVTHYKVLERFQEGYTFIELKLDTGRTHQIRVHMSHIGYPIVSDSLYGETESDLITRQALHAKELVFRHPITKNIFKIEAELPKDLVTLLEKLHNM